MNEQQQIKLQNELLELKDEVVEKILRNTFCNEESFFSDECIATVTDAIAQDVTDMEINQCIELCYDRGYTYLAGQLTNLATRFMHADD